MARLCVHCSPNGAICDFCRFASHNKPSVDQRTVHATVCEKHGGKRDLMDGCDDFECFGGEKYGWADEAKHG